ncbi:Enoyl-(Acyl carrier protein) reductase [Ceratobasidium sp. AG-Ba]|nr:Enoyl-(Acyl carrier protein) reductase [Ceratobasidium sp. AG-Ba]QRW07112.1 Enoyl-(Acyl carrier protein) reductase [Ceratobasidium sp. AG-Ba]
MQKVAIVTGAAQGLELASDGIDVAVNDLPSQRQQLDDLVSEINGLGRRSIVNIADVSKEAEVQTMVKDTVEKLGGLDIMVANAGTLQLHSVLEVPEEAFDRIMAVNCKGTLYCYRAAATQMIKQGRGGRIIGASSTMGISAMPLHVSYVTSKFAVRAITQTAALEWGRYNITVNAYAPGIFDTPMLATNASNIDGLIDSKTIEVLAQTPVKRVGNPAELAALVSFLASDGASYITGQTLMANGGLLTS